MQARSSIGALSLCLVALSLSALSNQRGARPSVPADRARPAPRSAPAGPSVRALRDGQPIDLNAASAAELELLPGIGPTLAARIVDDRQRAGRFSSVAQLERVPGIGPRKRARLSRLVRVRSPATPTAAPTAGERSIRVEEQHEPDAGPEQ